MGLVFDCLALVGKGAKMKNLHLALAAACVSFSLSCSLQRPTPALIADPSNYCEQLIEDADTGSDWLFAGGLFVATAAGASAIVGAAIGPDEDEDATNLEKNRNAILVASSGLLVPLATYLFERSSAYSDGSAAATTAAGSKSQLSGCIDARAQMRKADGAAAKKAGEQLAQLVTEQLKENETDTEQAENEQKAAADAVEDAETALAGLYDTKNWTPQSIVPTGVDVDAFQEFAKAKRTLLEAEEKIKRLRERRKMLIEILDSIQ